MTDGVMVVTGGASGIGLACAKAMAADHERVALIDINAETLAAAADEIAAAGGSAETYTGDVSDAAANDELAAKIEADLGAVRTVVTAAGILQNSTTVMDMDLDEHARVWDVNYHGTVFSARAFARAMIERRGGSILMIGSTNSFGAFPLPAYGPGKTAIVRFMEILAVELGRFGIRVNGIAPTYVLTPALKARIESGDRDENVIRGAGAIDMFVHPEDVADVAHFLCSDKARTVSGCMMPVDVAWKAATIYRSYAGGVPWDS